MEEAREFATLVMADNNDKIEVSVGSKGLSVTLEGKPASNTGRGLGDLLKPLIHFLGEKGDEIEFQRDVKREIRVFNKEALKQSLELAIETAKEQNVPLKPVPLKVLAQWAEGASLEDDTATNNLKESWARLLVSEILNSNPNSMIYSSFLKQMTRDHAYFLEGICKGKEASYFKTQAARVTEEAIASISDPFLRPYFRDGFPKKEILVIINGLQSAFDIAGLHVFSFYAETMTKKSLKEHDFTLDFTCRPIPRHSIVRESLEVLGLVKREFVETSSGGLSITCHCVTLTDLGMDFVASCIAERLTQK